MTVRNRLLERGRRQGVLEAASLVHLVPRAPTKVAAPSSRLEYIVPLEAGKRPMHNMPMHWTVRNEVTVISVLRPSSSDRRSNGFIASLLDSAGDQRRKDSALDPGKDYARISRCGCWYPDRRINGQRLGRRGSLRSARDIAFHRVTTQCEIGPSLFEILGYAAGGSKRNTSPSRRTLHGRPAWFRCPVMLHS